MTLQEKREHLDNFCNSIKDCEVCPLWKVKGWSIAFSGKYPCLMFTESPENEIDKALAIIEAKDEKVADDPVNHPSHYTDGKIEVIDFIEDKKLGFCLGNAVKYIARAGKKDPSKEIEDLKKAAWYVARRIQEIEGGLV